MKKDQLKKLLLSSGWVVSSSSDVLSKVCTIRIGERTCQIILLRSSCRIQFRSLHAEEWFTVGQSHYKDVRLRDGIVVIGSVNVQVIINE